MHHHTRKLALRRPEIEGLGRFAAALEAALAVFVVGGSFLPFQYNEMLWQMIGLSIALKRTAASRETARQAAEARTTTNEPGFAFEGSAA